MKLIISDKQQSCLCRHGGESHSLEIKEEDYLKEQDILSEKRSKMAIAVFLYGLSRMSSGSQAYSNSSLTRVF